MQENLNNDNLERFFKANLEQFAPVPSNDFWSRMESAIPPKPSFWNSHNASIWRWAGLGLLLVGLIMLAVLWKSDRMKLSRLSKTVAMQQRQIEQLGKWSKQDVASTEAPMSVAGAGIAATEKSTEADEPISQGAPVFGQKNQQTRAVGRIAAGETQQKEKPQATITSVPSIIQNELNFVESPAVANQEAGLGALQSATSPFELEETAPPPGNVEYPRTFSPAPIPLAVGHSPFLTKKNPALTFKFKPARPTYKPYPRFSIESGASAFVIPLSNLFTGDTLYTGRIRPSFSTGMLVTYDLNRKLSFQTGYQFKDLRSARMSLRYNSYPFLLRKQWGWGRRSRLEGKTGLTLNSLLSARTSTDGLAVRGLQNTWIGWQGSFGVAYPVSERLTLVTAPSIGVSLTPIANQRRIWEGGLGMSLRYRFW